jgi:anthranilate synthase component 1
MVQVADDNVVIKPIAGTRPRGKTHAADMALEKELLADEKERAEHLMLIDLARNDLGRIAQAGTVKVTNAYQIERYAYVMHIVSEVNAKKLPQVTTTDIIKASFPAGTVSGAPKIKAIEIISELEPMRRGPYAGLVGYYDINGNFDSCIAIRSVVHKGNTYFVQAGAGIVHDSVPEKEYEETLNKAKATVRALGVNL